MKAEPFQKLAEAAGLRDSPRQQWPAAPSPSGENAIVSNGLQTGRLSLTWLRDSLRALFAAFLMAGLVGCRSTPPALAESSVKPDVNAEFLKPDLQVTQWIERFEREGREIYDQREAITQAIGLRPGMRVVREALKMGQPEGFIRTFVDFGEPMKFLLERMKSEGGELKDYVLTLLAAFWGGSAQGLPSQPQVEAMSGRELEILHLMASGLSNREIAARLVITVGTAKSHVHHILEKLGTESRMQAVAKARELGLV